MSRMELVGARELGGQRLRDILGAYELVGAGWSPAMGMAPNYAPPRPAYAPRAPLAGNWAYAPHLTPPQQVGYSQQTGVVSKEPTKVRRHYIPMNSNGTVAAAAAASISTQPQALAFRPERIVVPASIAPDFTIDSIFCGIKPQFVATGSIAAETFTQDARDVEMHMDTVNTSQNFTLNVTNQSGAARQFRATVFGVTADD